MSSYNDNNYDYTILSFKEMRKGLIYMYDRGKKVDDNTYLLNVEIGVGNRKYNQFKKRLLWFVLFLRNSMERNTNRDVTMRFLKDKYSIFLKIYDSTDQILENKDEKYLFNKICNNVEYVLKNENEIKLTKDVYFFFYFCLSFKPLIEKMNSNNMSRVSKYIFGEFIFSIYLELLFLFENFDKEDSDSIVNKFKEFEENYNNNLIIYREIYNKFSDKTFNDNLFYNINIEFYNKVSTHNNIFEKFSHIDKEECISTFNMFFYNIGYDNDLKDFQEVPWGYYKKIKDISNITFFYENMKVMNKIINSNIDTEKWLREVLLRYEIDEVYNHIDKQYESIIDSIYDLKTVINYQYLYELSGKFNEGKNRKNFITIFSEVISQDILTVFNKKLYNKLTVMEEYKERLFLINNEDND